MNRPANPVHALPRLGPFAWLKVGALAVLFVVCVLVGAIVEWWQQARGADEDGL